MQWRRGYAYEAGSNRLVSTSLPGDDPDDPPTHSEVYGYNVRGGMTFLPHLKPGVASNVTLDFRDQLRRAELDASGNVAWYAYDGAGQRIRKLWDKGAVKEERIYVGGYEVWRRRNSGGTVQEERQTLHVMDDERRIAMAETLTRTGGAPVPTPTTRLRYQLDDHLGTALLEVDEAGAVITYEEYHPYGTTAWHAANSAIQVSAKRYRYTGREKDEETGLSYHGARYYAPWLGRWTAADPAGMIDGSNRHVYVRGNPVGGRDPTGLKTSAEVVFEREQRDLLQGKITPEQVQENREARAAGAAVGGAIVGAGLLAYATGAAAAAGSALEVVGATASAMETGFAFGASQIAAMEGSGAAALTAGAMRLRGLATAGAAALGLTKAVRPSAMDDAFEAAARVTAGRSGIPDGPTVRSETGTSLVFHENVGALVKPKGHTIAQHVGKTDVDLASRLQARPHLEMASSFPDVGTAERAIGEVLEQNRAAIRDWVEGGFKTKDLPIEGSRTHGATAGRVLPRGASAAHETSDVTVVLRHDPDVPETDGWRIHTAYPGR